MAKLEDYPITLADAAKQLGATPNCVRRLAAAGLLPSRCFGPLRELRFRTDDVEAFAAANDTDRKHRELLNSIEALRPLHCSWGDPAE